MAVTNSAKFEESTEILIDSQVEAAAAGWAINFVSVNRIGNLISVHLEATNNANAAALVTTLQSEFAPAVQLTDSTGNFTVGADGTVSYNGSRTASAKHVLDINYQAASVSP